MSRPPESDRSTYLPTGWRVTGASAKRIAERAADLAAERLLPGAASNTLFAVQFTAAPVVGGRPTVERLLDAITDDVRQTWAECPRLVRDAEVDRPPARFGGLRFEMLAVPGKEWNGEVVWRSVHPVVAGAPVTTWVLIEERPTYTRVSVRVTADDGLGSVRGFVGAGQIQPGFLKALRGQVTPIWQGGPLEVRRLRNGEIADLVYSILPAASRAVPLVVQAPLEDGDYVIDPEVLAWELFGRARLYVLQEHRHTFELTDTIGDRRMSCYWGAARAYMPGWSRHDDPFDHPLLIGDRLGDPVMRAAWLGELGVWMGTRLTLPDPLDERRTEEPVERVGPPSAAVSGAAAAGARRADPPRSRDAARESDGASAGAGVEEAGDDAGVAPSPSQSEFGPLLETLIADVRGLGKAVANLTDEVERLRTISAVRSSSTTAIERRLASLEDILERAFPEGLPDTDEPEAEAVEETAGEPEEGEPSLVAVVHDAAQAHPDALVFLDSATTSAADSPYEDPERVRAILDAMARVSRRRRDGLLGTSLRDAFADLGIDYRGAIARSTSARLREQYRFRHGRDLVEAEEHIVLGNTYDPRRCLRIYFSSRVPNEPRFVIGHVGRHFQVKSTT